MGRGVDVPWVGGQNTMGRVVDIPLVEGQNTIGSGSIYIGYGAPYTIDRGSKYHG